MNECPNCESKSLTQTATGLNRVRTVYLCDTSCEHEVNDSECRLMHIRQSNACGIISGLRRELFLSRLDLLKADDILKNVCHHDEIDYSDCEFCNGTGEGKTPDSSCSKCGGSGVGLYPVCTTCGIELK